MPADHRTTIGGVHDVEREWSRLIDDLARCGFLALPGAADALLGAGDRPGRQAEDGGEAGGR